MKVKLTDNQRADLVAAAAHPHGLYQPKKPNRIIRDNLRYQRLLAIGPAVPESECMAKLEEAATALQAAAAHAAAGEFYEAEGEAWHAQRIYARLRSEEYYITDEGRAAAVNGFYQGRDGSI